MVHDARMVSAANTSRTASTVSVACPALTKPKPSASRLTNAAAIKQHDDPAPRVLPLGVVARFRRTCRADHQAGQQQIKGDARDPAGRDTKRQAQKRLGRKAHRDANDDTRSETTQTELADKRAAPGGQRHSGAAALFHEAPTGLGQQHGPGTLLARVGA